MTQTLADHCRERRFGPAVTARVLRLNPDPAPEGVWLRGIHPRPTLWRMSCFNGCIGRKEYEAKWGLGTWRRIQKRYRVRYTGCRWCVSYRDFQEGVHNG